VAILDTTIPVFIGRVVTLVSAHAPGSLLHDNWPQLVAMALVLLVARPAALLLQNLITNQGIIPSFSNLIRWQSHWHVVRQSWAFFQNDFAGRIAQRVMQTGPSLRESVVSATNAVWYILVYGGGAIILMASNDTRLAIPVLLWFAGYAMLLAPFRATVAHPFAKDVRDTFGADRSRRGQLHEHPDGQTFRPAARRGRIRPCVDGRSDRCLPRPAAVDNYTRAEPSHPECDAGRWYRGDRDLVVERGANPGRQPSRWRCR